VDALLLRSVSGQHTAAESCVHARTRPTDTCKVLPRLGAILKTVVIGFDRHTNPAQLQSECTRVARREPLLRVVAALTTYVSTRSEAGADQLR